MAAHTYPPMLELVRAGVLRPDLLVTSTIPLDGVTGRAGGDGYGARGGGDGHRAVELRAAHSWSRMPMITQSTHSPVPQIGLPPHAFDHESGLLVDPQGPGVVAVGLQLDPVQAELLEAVADDQAGRLGAEAPAASPGPMRVRKVQLRALLSHSYRTTSPTSSPVARSVTARSRRSGCS